MKLDFGIPKLGVLYSESRKNKKFLVRSIIIEVILYVHFYIRDPEKK